jgi:hypothetical protein
MMIKEKVLKNLSKNRLRVKSDSHREWKFMKYVGAILVLPIFVLGSLMWFIAKTLEDGMLLLLDVFKKFNDK